MMNYTFEKNSEVVPLLVRLYDTHKLYDLAKDKQPLARAEITSAVADLLDAGLTPREQELLTDVLISLIRQAEKDLRQAVAERLAIMPNVPLRIILHLANDEIPVAAPILKQSAVLGDLDLLYIIKAKGPDYWQAIAARDGLSPRIVDVLADTHDAETVIALTKNERVRLTAYAVNILGDMATVNENLAKPLLLRPELPPTLVRKIYAHAGEEIKNFISSYHNISDADIHDTIDGTIIEFTEAERLEFMPTARIQDIARKFSTTGNLNMTVMLDTLKRGQVSSFIAMFAVYTGLTSEHVYNILMQASGKKLAILCRGHSVMKGEFSTIYLMTNRMRSKDRVVDHRVMLEALAYFDSIRPEVARRIVTQNLDI